MRGTENLNTGEKARKIIGHNEVEFFFLHSNSLVHHSGELSGNTKSNYVYANLRIKEMGS